MSAPRHRNDWAEIWAVAKCCVLILALLAAYLGLGGCVIAPWGYDRGGGYQQQHDHYRGYWGGQGRGY